MSSNYREKRRYPRIEAKVQVAFSSKEELIQEYVKNISKGGIFLKVDRPLDPNADIDLTLSFPGSTREFRVAGRVTRLMTMSHPQDLEKQIYGAGIRFIDAPEEMIQAIEVIAEDMRNGS